MKKVNIQGINEIDDPFYRYQRHQFEVNSLKNKTQINNFETVCKDIEREPKNVITFLKKKLGMNINYKDSIITLNSQIQKDILENALNDYIEKHVLCPNCKLPETVIENNDLRKCKACPYSGKN